MNVDPRLQVDQVVDVPLGARQLRLPSGTLRRGHRRLQVLEDALHRLQLVPDQPAANKLPREANRGGQLVGGAQRLEDGVILWATFAAEQAARAVVAGSRVDDVRC